VLTVTETLRLYSAAYPLPLEVGEVLELVGLDAQRNARVSALSGGQHAGSTLRSASPAIPSCSSSTNPPPGSTPLPDAGRGS
jgi:hypothetical protein